MSLTCRYIPSDNERDWHHARSQGVTATDMATLHTGTPAAFAAIANTKRNPTTIPTTKAMAWGKDREAVILQWLRDTFGYTIQDNGTTLAVHHETPLYVATPDAIGTGEYDNVIFEVKTTNTPWPTNGHLPERYMIQVQWQLFVTGADFCIFVYEQHENYTPVDIRVVRIDPNADEIARLVDIADAFIASYTEAAPTPNEAMENLLEMIAEKTAIVDKTKAEIDELRAQIIALYNGDEFAYSGIHGSCTHQWRTPTERLDTKAIANDLPEVYSKYRLVTNPKAPTLTIRLAK